MNFHAFGNSKCWCCSLWSRKRTASMITMLSFILVSLMIFGTFFVGVACLTARQALAQEEGEMIPVGDMTEGAPPPGEVSPESSDEASADAPEGEESEFYGEEAPPPEVMQDFEVTTQDLDAVEATILPDSPLHIFKRIGRGVQEAFTFDPVADAELKLQHANQQIAEVKQLIDETGLGEVDPGTVAGAIDIFEKKFEDVKDTAEALTGAKTTATEEVEEFLNEVTDKQLKHQQVLDNIAEEVMEVKKEAEIMDEEVDRGIERVLVSVQDTKDKSMADFTDMLMEVDVEPERMSTRITAVMEQQGGSEFKALKNLEVLDAVYEKVPETAKAAIEQARQNTIQRFEIRISNIPEAVRAERFGTYIEHAVTDETRLISLLDEIKQSTGIPDDLLAKIEMAKEMTVRRFEDKLRLIDSAGVAEGYFRNFETDDVGDMIALEEFKNRMSAESNELAFMEDVHAKSLGEFKKRFTDVTSEEQAKRFQKLSEELLNNPSPKTFRLVKELEAEVQADPAKKAFIEGIEKAMTQQFETRFRREGDRFMDRIVTLDPRDIGVFEELEFEGGFRDSFMEANTGRFKDFMRDVREPEHFDRFHERFFEVPEYVIDEIKRNDTGFEDAMRFKVRKMEEMRTEKEREIARAKLDYEEREVHFQMDRHQRQKEDEFWNNLNEVEWDDFDTRKVMWEEKMNDDYEIVEQRFVEQNRIFEDRLRMDPWCDEVCQQIQMQFMEQDFRHEQERLADDLVRERNRIEMEKGQHMRDNPLAGKCDSPESCDEYCKKNPGVPGCEWMIGDVLHRQGPPSPMFKDCPPGEFWDGFKQSCIFDPYFRPPTDFKECPPNHHWNDMGGFCEPDFHCGYMMPPPPCMPGEMPIPPDPHDPCGQPSCIEGMPVICPMMMPAPCPPGQFREARKDPQGCPIFGECISGGGMHECPPEYMPVCGDDNITYNNDCEAKKAGMAIRYFGPCDTVMGGCSHDEYWEPMINKCLPHGSYVPYQAWNCDYGWVWRNEGYCEQDTNVSGQCKHWCEPPCMGMSFCMYDEYGCASGCSPECGFDEYFDPGLGQCVQAYAPPPQPGDTNWVSHTWSFSDGMSETTYILGRTDQQYLDYIASMHAQCLTIPKSSMAWRPGSKSDSDWASFGIPDCSSTVVAPPADICGDGICGFNEYCPEDCEGGWTPDCPVSQYNVDPPRAACNHSICPDPPGCEYDAKGCPVGCATEPYTGWCGDGMCSPETGETVGSCPADCGAVGTCPSNMYNDYISSYNCSYTQCPNGCEYDNQGCPSGCMTTTGWCGDGVCDDITETADSCPSDCGGMGCDYDGVCDVNETMSSCPSDCGSTTACPAGTYYCPEKGVNNIGTYCHLTPCDGVTDTCPANSWTTNAGACDYAYCSDGCTFDNAGCPSGCLVSGGYCGDGTCNVGETVGTCPSDCGTGATTCPSSSYTTSAGACDYAFCPSGCTFDNQGCPSGCLMSIGYCGDGICNMEETMDSCPSDCGGSVSCPSNIYNNYGDNVTCNWTECPDGCRFDQNGCPDGCWDRGTSGGWCGDGICQPGEQCPSDCGGTAGGCESITDEATCLSDPNCGVFCAGEAWPCYVAGHVCGGTTGWCGDGICEMEETMSSCPSDCGGGSGNCPSNMYNDWTGSYTCSYTQCPNGCDFDSMGCPTNCMTSAGWCGDGMCNNGETTSSCPGDCGTAGGYCGDGVCDSFEDSAGCPSDCGGAMPCGANDYNNWTGEYTCNYSYCPDGCEYDGQGCPYACMQPSNYCGDGMCDGATGEDQYSCPMDCGEPAPTGYCGDGMCDSGETMESCPGDCGGGAPPPGDPMSDCTSGGGTWCGDWCEWSGNPCP